jgi:predicted kinase
VDVIRPDDLLPQGPGRWTKQTVGEAWAEAHRRLRTALADPAVREIVILVGVPGAGKTTWVSAQHRPGAVAFDAVSADPRRRAALARRIVAAGKLATAVHVQTPFGLCLQRNAARPVWRRVPEAFMRRVARALLTSPPNRSEGWTSVETVGGLA